MSLINPKYLDAAKAGDSQLCKQSQNRNTGFYKHYAPDILPLQEQLYTQVKPAGQQAMWPAFSLKKIKLFPGETLTDLLLANAIVLAQEYTRLTPGASIEAKVIEYYNELASKRISLASPFFNNLRKPGNRNLSSCFIMQVGDSLTSIMKHVTYCAQISKAGGGAGVDLSLVRAKGAKVNGHKNAASSIMNWVRMFDQVCVSVNQLGQRPGAITVALPIWHADIEEFLDCQTENGDLRAKAYNIQPQVCIPDEFMFALEANEEYCLFCPKQLSDEGIEPGKNPDWYIRAVKLGLYRIKIPARKLWATIQERQRTLGRPYIFFTDNAQVNSPFKRSYGNINSANLCVESYSYFEAERYVHCCNLISINLGEHEDLQSVSRSTSIATEMADLSLNLSYINIPEAQAHTKDFRTIGLGLMGLADWLAKHGEYYSSLNFIEETQKTITKAAYATSVKLAEKWGSCLAYDSLTSELWDLLDSEPDLNPSAELRAIHGIRNSMMLATAPNTSTSLTMGSTASFLPPYKHEFYDESENHTLSVVTKYGASAYLTAAQIPCDFITDATSVMQKWCDAGFSMEYLLPSEASWATNKAFSETKVKAWKAGVKAVYYIRTSENNSEPGGCSSGSCSN